MLFLQADIPSTDAGMSKFLIQNYKGIGKKAAEKIVLHFAKQPGGLESFRKQLLANPYAMWTSLLLV